MATAMSLRTDKTAAERRRLAAASKNANHSRRLLSRAAVLDARPQTARSRRLTAAHLAELARAVATGPDLATPGVVRWRPIDLKRLIEERFGVVSHERTIGKLLTTLGVSHISGRPHHPGQDAGTL